MVLFSEPTKRKAFTKATKQQEWLAAGGHSEDGRWYQTSKCRQCRRALRWGDRSYDFDHRDNNPANNSRSNCYLVCKSCHGKVTKVEKWKSRGLLGVVTYRTVKRKVGYKKRRASTTRKRTARVIAKKPVKRTVTRKSRVNSFVRFMEDM